MAEISDVTKNTYQMTFSTLEQQMGSKLQDAVIRENVEGEFYFTDSQEAADFIETFTRNADTVNQDLTFERRRLGLRRFNYAPMIDSFDKIALINDPTFAATSNALYGAGRRKDALIVEAAYGTTYGSYDNSTSFVYDTNNTIAVNEGGAGNVGLTVEKLRAMAEIFEAADVPDEIPKFIAGTAKQKRDLLASTEVTSADYASVKALVHGVVDSFMGFTFIWVNGSVDGAKIIPVDGSGYRRVLAWAQDGLTLGVGKDVATDIQIRVDKNNSYQLWHEMFIGANRTSEKKVGSILCSEV